MKLLYLYLILSVILVKAFADRSQILQYNREEAIDLIKNETFQIMICGTKPEIQTTSTTPEGGTTSEGTATTSATDGITKSEATTTDDEILVSTSGSPSDDDETPTEEEKENKRLLNEEKEFNMTDKAELENIIKGILSSLYPEGVTIQKVEIPTIEEPFSLIINVTLNNTNSDNAERVKELNYEISSNNNDTFYNKLNETTKNIYNKCRLQDTTICQYNKQIYKYITTTSTTNNKKEIRPKESPYIIEGSCTNKDKTTMDGKSGKITIDLSTELKSLCRIQCRDYLKNDGYGVVSIKVINEDEIDYTPSVDKVSYPVMVYLNEPFNVSLKLKYPEIISNDDDDENNEEEKIKENNNNNIGEKEEFTMEMVIINENNNNLTMNEQESTHTTNFKFTNANITIRENKTFTSESDEIVLSFRNESNLFSFHNVTVTVISQPCPDPDEMGVCCVHKPGELCSNLTLSFSFLKFTSRLLLADNKKNENNEDMEFRTEFKNVLDETVFIPQDCSSTDISEKTALDYPLVLSIKRNGRSGGNDDGDSTSSIKSDPIKITTTISLEEAFKGIIEKIEMIQNNEIPEVATLLKEKNIILDPENPITYSQVINNYELPSFEPSSGNKENNDGNNGEKSNWAKDNWYVILIIVLVVLLLIVGGVFGGLYIRNRKKNSNNSNLPTHFKSITASGTDNNNDNKSKKNNNNKKYQAEEKHQSIEDLEPVGDNVVSKVSIDINNNNSYNNNNNNYTSDNKEEEEEVNKFINKKPIKYEGYLEKRMPTGTITSATATSANDEEWVLRYCVLYANPSILYIYENMKPSYKGNVYTAVKQIIPLESIETIKYDKRRNKEQYDFNIIMKNNDQQVQSNECMEDLQYVHLRIPADDYVTTVNSFNEWIKYLNEEDEKPSMVKDAWGGNDDDEDNNNGNNNGFISDNGENNEEEENDDEDQQNQYDNDDTGDVKIDFDDNNYGEGEGNDEQEQKRQTPPPPPPRKIVPPPSPSSPDEATQKPLNESPDKPTLPIGRVKAHRDIGLRDEP